MHKDLLEVLQSVPLSEAAKEALSEHTVFGADRKSPAMLELTALEDAVEGLVGEAEIYLHEAGIESHGIDMHKGVRDSMVALKKFEETTRNMQDLLSQGVKNVDKHRIQGALATAFTRDMDAELVKLQQGFAEWEGTLQQFTQQHEKKLKGTAKDLLDAAQGVAKHASARCGQIEMGPAVAAGLV